MTKRLAQFERRRGMTLFELLVVVALLAILTGLVGPRLLDELQTARLPNSANQLRALIQLTRANAMIEGRRYRIRFPLTDELDGQGEQRQPIVEVEPDPLEDPGAFYPVLASWAQDVTFEREVRCARVRLGRPTVAVMQGKAEDDDSRTEMTDGGSDTGRKGTSGKGETFEEDFPPLLIEPDGTTEWATFILTEAPLEIAADDLANENQSEIDVIVDGLTGLCWLQRRLSEEELQMMEEHAWPPVLRRDFLDPTALTENDVLEIREELVRK